MVVTYHNTALGYFVGDESANGIVAEALDSVSGEEAQNLPLLAFELLASRRLYFDADDAFVGMPAEEIWPTAFLGIPAGLSRLLDEMLLGLVGVLPKPANSRLAFGRACCYSRHNRRGGRLIDEVARPSQSRSRPGAAKTLGLSCFWRLRCFVKVVARTILRCLENYSKVLRP